MRNGEHLTDAGDSEMHHCIEQTHEGQASWAGWQAPNETCATCCHFKPGRRPRHGEVYGRCHKARDLTKREVARFPCDRSSLPVLGGGRGMREAVYEASPLKRRRATQDEMEARAKFLIDYAAEHGPVTVRGLYYQAEVSGVPGIDKTDSSYVKVQRQVLNLRREGRLAYGDISDATRWMRKPRSHNSVEDAIAHTARTYRRSLWADAEDYVEVWCEKDALAGVIYPVTAEFDVPLMVARGFASETFCYEAIDARQGDDRDYYVYYLGDFDRAGRDAARSLEEKLTRFAEEDGIEVIFEQIAVTERQIADWKLPTRKPKRQSPADRNWRHSFACELDAIPPDRMRALVEAAIIGHVDHDQLAIVKVAEESERELLKALGRG